MADDELNPSAGATEDSSQDMGGGQSAPTFAPDHDSDAEQPRPETDDSNADPDALNKQYDEVHNGLQSVINQQRINNNDYYVFQKELDDIQQESRKEDEIKPPVPYALPAPPDQTQKGKLGVLFTNLLKWGAMIGLSAGVARASGRADAFPAAMAHAIKGYYDGNNRRRDRQLQLWEKNRQYLMDMNRLQHQQYKDAVNTQKTNLRMKFDILNAQSKLWNDKRMQDASERQDMMAVQKLLNDRMRRQHDMESEIRRDRKDWYKLMGLSGLDGAKYRDWVISKGGPDITPILKAEGSGSLNDKEKDDIYEIEKKYPRDKMLKEELHEKEQEKSDTRFKEFKREQEYKAHEKESESGSSDNPLGLNLGQ